MVEQVSFKVFLEPVGEAGEREARRFVVDKDVSTSFTYLTEKLRSVFSSQLQRAAFTVSWLDEDKDKVTINSDEELIIALTEMPGPLYKLNVQLKTEKKGGNIGEAGEAGQVHHGVTCDSCEKAPIHGYRYKCVVCDDYDLCGACEAAGRHPGHNMMRITAPGQVFPQRLFKRIQKMQERAEKKGHSEVRGDRMKNVQEQMKEVEETFNAAFSPGTGEAGRCGGAGRGRVRGRGGFGGMRGMRGGCGWNGWAGPGAWAAPTFDAMMRGWMGEQGDSAHQTAHQTAHENAAKTAADAHKKAHEAATEASEAAAEAHSAAFEQFAANMTGSADYLQNVGNFVAAALDPLGINVTVDIETPEGEKQSCETSKRFSTEEEKPEPRGEKGDILEPDNSEEKSKSPTPSEDEEWTVVNDRQKPELLYPVLPDTETAAPPVVPELLVPVSVPEVAVDSAPPVDGASALPAAPPVVTTVTHPDPKIQVALQAMVNMGFTNEGGWLAGLLEAKQGDIGKVLDILQPVKK